MKIDFSTGAFGMFALASAVSASPLVTRQTQSTISITDFNNTQLYEQYAAAAYCGRNHDPVNTDPGLRCVAGNCPRVEQAGATALLKVSNRR
jgi:hypothetical protein